jgi:aspartyl-tRNA(Asn)/glutamyl-tRNA(Gln) amidotransferase subunit C
MLELSSKDIEQIATLARLELSDAEKDRYAKELSVVFDFMELLNEMDVSDVSETCQVTGLTDVTRNDEAESCADETKKKLIEAFPDRVGNLLRVPGIFDDGNQE